MGDSTAHGGNIAVGCPTVRIGRGGGSGKTDTVTDKDVAVDSGFPVSKAEAGAALRQALKEQRQMLLCANYPFERIPSTQFAVK